VAENPELGPERADQHDRLIALAEHELEVKFKRADRPLTADERGELRQLMTLYGDRGKPFSEPWNRASFEDRFALVQERWKGEEEAAYYLDYMYEVIQRRNNLLLHGSPTAYRQTIVERPNGQRQLNRIGPDRLWRETLGHGAGGYYMVCRVLAQEFDFDKEPMAEVFNRATCYLKPIEHEPGIAKLPADAECPCGSGRIVNKCHRSRSPAEGGGSGDASACRPERASGRWGLRLSLCTERRSDHFEPSAGTGRAVELTKVNPAAA
jgi:hypothetical protein